MLRLTSKYTHGQNEFNTIFTIWEPQVNESGKSMNANATTSKKCGDFDKKVIEDGLANKYNGNNYITSKWRVRFIGEAFNKANKHGMENSTKITNVVGDMTNEAYWLKNKDGEFILDYEGKKQKRYGIPTITISSFDYYENNNSQSKGIDTPPKVETEDDDELPF